MDLLEKRRQQILGKNYKPLSITPIHGGNSSIITFQKRRQQIIDQSNEQNKLKKSSSQVKITPNQKKIDPTQLQRPTTVEQVDAKTPLQKIAKNVLVTAKNVPEAHFADKAKFFTPLGFVESVAQGLINTPQEAVKGAISLGEHAGSGTSTPQQVVGDVAAAVQLPLLILTFGGSSIAKEGVAGAAKEVVKDVAERGAVKAIGERVIEGAATGGKYGLLGGFQSGKNITNAKDYVNNLLENVGIGAASGGLLEGGLAGLSKVALPLAKGLSSKLGAVFVKSVDKTPVIDHIELDPKVAQSAVIGNDKVAKSEAGKEIMKQSVLAAQTGEHVAITPTETGGSSLPDGRKVKIEVVKPYDPNQKTPYDTPDIIKTRQEQTSIESTDKINTPERDALRTKIADDLYKNGGYADASKRPTTEIKSEKRADIVTGLPASGKNTVISDPLVKEHGAILVDSDEAKYGIPESNNGTYNGAVHNESTTINAEVLNKAVENGNNVVLPLVGRNSAKVIATAERLKAEGYEVHLHHNEVSVETSIERAIKRHKETGKFVDPNYIMDVGLKPNENYDKIKMNPAFSSYEKYSNEVKPGEKPRLIERSGRSSNGLNDQNARRTGEKSQSSTENSSKVERSFDKSGKEIIPSSGKRVLNTKEVTAVKQVIADRLRGLREMSGNAQDVEKAIDDLYTEVVDKANNDKVVLSALRTELNKEMFGYAGTDTTNYKAAYAQLQTVMKEDPELGGILGKMQEKIIDLDKKLLTAQEPARIKPNIETGKPKEHTASQTEPVGTGKPKETRAYKRMVDHLAETDPETFDKVKDDPKLLYNTVNQKFDFENAAKIVEEDPNKAYRIAKQLEPAPANQRWESVNIVLADRALAEKNYSLWKDLEQSRSLAQTRAGQGIVAERGRFNENSPHTYVQRVLDARLTKLGKGYVTSAIDTVKENANSAKAKAIAKIDAGVERAMKFTAKERSKINFAQNLLDQLTCK